MSWRKFLFQHYKAKIVIFLIAVFLWFFVVSSRQYVYTLRVHLRTTHLKPDQIFIETPPPYVEVRFRGRGTSLILLSLFGEPHIDLDLTPVDSVLQYALAVEHVQWASSIDVQALEIIGPKSVRLKLGTKRLIPPPKKEAGSR